MTFITHEPLESIPDVERDVCDADGCSQTDDLALVTNSERGRNGVYCPDCASIYLFGGKA